ncbi:CinA family protein [Pseudidiomarina taiwanensis]|uniref:Damage-inducible protein CinA n=1 Tax=Pseudidiomarina taiwanensis TaxID=337250 RepID=A0A432ZNH8_9GAMM|nr:CinA family protein [Pseudidiomarina taiwanensis]RUO79444.1 damage-inducible protein CinA [Pseudidiomarina taiwanensis]
MVTMLSQSILHAAADLGQFLQAKNYHIATAESCTGGGIGYAMSAIAGSSAWFAGGYITYSNALKQQELGVSSQCLAEHGAVSAETAAAMASGARARAQVEIAVAVTGIAGPDGGIPEKPVGLVWFGLATPTNVMTWAEHFSGDRDAVRSATILTALQSFKKIT